MDIFDKIDAKAIKEESDKEKLQKTRTGLSMQATVMSALASKLPTSNPGPVIQG